MHDLNWRVCAENIWIKYHTAKLNTSKFFFLDKLGGVEIRVRQTFYQKLLVNSVFLKNLEQKIVNVMPLRNWVSKC